MEPAAVFLRRCIEFAVAAWLPGIAPFLAHLYFTAQRRDAGYEWIPADLYLFVMVSGGAVAFEAFNDRRSDGPYRSVVGIAGFLMFVVGAGAYGSLETGGVDAYVLRYGVRWAIALILATHLLYKIPVIWGAARQEAEQTKGRHE